MLVEEMCVCDVLNDSVIGDLTPTFPLGTGRDGTRFSKTREP